ncbi:MAG: hypothetical protein LC656_04770, partial [Sphingomonadales bacterium]|nr:hypothetical protein [Sphingomonadales bacterium]
MVVDLAIGIEQAHPSLAIEAADRSAKAGDGLTKLIALALFGGDPRLTSEDSMRQIAAAIEGFSEARLLALMRLPQIPVT